MYTPYKHQVEPIRICTDILTSKRPRKEIVVAPTGMGKALLAAFSAKNVDFPLIILQPSKELLLQNYEKYIAIGGEASIYSASLKSKELGHVTFATIGSIKKEVAYFKKLGLKGIIVDECHLKSKSGSDVREFIKSVGVQNVLGLTATPLYLESSMSGAELKMMTKVRGTLFRNIAHVTQISDLVDKKAWTPLKYEVVNQDGSVLSSNSTGADYTSESLKKFYLYNNIEQQIVRSVETLKMANKKSILVFVDSIEQAEALKSKISSSVVVHSKMSDSERDFAVSSFKAGSFDVAISIGILSTGYDDPKIDGIIMARPTMSLSIYYQQIGRGVRLFKGKEECTIVDLAGNFNKFGKVEDFKFEFIEGFGWALFNKKEELLSNFPIAAEKRPTKTSLIESIKRKTKQIVNNNVPEDEDVKLWFGKYNGRLVSNVAKENKSYLTFMLDKFEFNGEKMLKLKKCIENQLQI